MTTAKERVLAAITKALELLGELHAARADVLKAKAGEDEVRVQDISKQLMETSASETRIVDDLAIQEYRRAVELAQKPLEEAQTRYNTELAAATERRNREMAQIRETWDGKLRQAKQEQDLKAAEARAAVHIAQQKVAGIEATIDRHHSMQQQALGIDLKSLMRASEA